MHTKTISWCQTATNTNIRRVNLESNYCHVPKSQAVNRRQLLKCLAAVPLVNTVPLRANPAHTWRTAKQLPFPTQEIYAAVHNNHVAVAGGISSRFKLPYFTSRCVAYHPPSDSWLEWPELPEAVHHASLVSTGNRLFLVGGFSGSYKHVWRMRKQVLELSNKQWIATTALPQPQAEGVVSFGPDKKIHLVGGLTLNNTRNRKRSDHTETTNHWVWDGNANRWESAAPIPTARNSATGAWVGSQLIITGGRTRTGNLPTTEIYNVETDTWDSAEPMPLPQAGGACVAVKNGLIVFGGEIFTPEAAVFKEVWHYHVHQNRWQPLPSLPTPRHGLGAAKIGNNVFVVGGATEPSGSGTSNVNEVMTLPTD